jgi:hypothetical protein
VWKGTVLAQGNEASPEAEAPKPARANDLDRTGFAKMQLSSDDSGTGRVDHVAERVTIIFDIQRVTPDLVERWEASGTVEMLEVSRNRDRFALDYARRLAAGIA